MQDLTTGSITRHLLKTTSFMLVSMVFQTLYVLIDLYWVGRLGKEAVAAVGVAGNLTFIVLAVSQMLGVGTTTLVSHAVGRRDQARAQLVFNQSQVLGVVVGAVFLVVAMLLRPAYARTLSADATTAAMAADYLLWFIPAMSLQFGMVGMGSALRGTGNFKPGMIVQTATVIINMLLAPFLIFGWGTGLVMGVKGAALSTFVAVVIGIVWMSTYFLTPSSYLHFVPGSWRPQLRLWGQMLKVGLPAGAEFALMACFLFIVYVVSRPFGAAAQAGFGIGMRIVQAGFLPVVALGFAVAPVAGQNFGARRPERVRKTFTSAGMLAGSLMFLFALACHIAPAAMIRFFSSDPQVVAVGDEYLRISSWNFIASGIIFVSSSMFQAIGNTIPPLITSFVRLTVIAGPLFILAGQPGFALRWIWYLSVASITLQLILNLLLLRREFKVRLQFTAVPAT
jgi:putative MATE family efflux protein